MTQPAQPFWFNRSALELIDARAQAHFGIPLSVLMENAGRELSHVVHKYTEESSHVLILIGRGNNGGDGAVAARHLSNHGYPIVVASPWQPDDFCPPLRAALHTLSSMSVPVLTGFTAENLIRWRETSSVQDVIVDALYGTGLRRPLAASIEKLISAVNESMRRVISCDIPSGLDCDTGRTWGACVQAAHTVSYCGMKVGFHHPAALGLLGQVSIGDIGVPTCLLASLAIPEPE